MDLPGKLVGDDDDGCVFGLLGQCKPIQEINSHHLLRMPSNNRMDIDVVRRFVSRPLTYIASPYKLLHIFPHSIPREPSTQPVKRLPYPKVSCYRGLVVLAYQLMA